MASIHRTTFEDWPDRPGAAWLTQFNDLRLERSLGTDPKLTLLRELKMLLLLRRGAYVRDVDLVNSGTFQDLFLRNKDRLQDVVGGLLTPGLRVDVDGYEALNDLQKRRRARPRMHEDAKAFCIAFDRFLTERGKIVVGATSASVARAFDDRLQALVAPNGPLDDRQLRLLTEVIDRARQPDGVLYFGAMYPMLLEMGEEQDGELIQLIRAAHVLAVPARVGMSLSAADEDLLPGMVSRVLEPDTDRPEEGLALSEVAPPRVLGLQSLDRINFPQIASLRVTAEGGDYFQLLDALEEAARIHGRQSMRCEQAFVEYLAGLGRYIDRMASDLEVDLVDWREMLVRRRLERASLNATRAFAIPFAIGGVTGAVVSILTWGVCLARGLPLPAVTAAAAGASVFAAGNLVGQGLERLVKSRADDRRSSLRHVRLRGTSVHDARR